jgi:hypothetical protein
MTKYFFKFRQTSTKPPGQWVVCGPFDSYETAMADHQLSRAWDCQLSPVFPAASKHEAEAKPV